MNDHKLFFQRPDAPPYVSQPASTIVHISAPPRLAFRTEVDRNRIFQFRPKPKPNLASISDICHWRKRKSHLN